MLRPARSKSEAAPRADHRYDDVTLYNLDEDVKQKILELQTECTFIRGPKTNWAVGVLMTYVWRNGSFWVTATTQRARIHAIRRDPARVGQGLQRGNRARPRQGDHRQGTRDHPTDRETKDWFHPARAAANIPTPGKLQDVFAMMLETDRRVVIEVVPEKWITFDATKMMMASIEAWREMGILDED